MVLRFLLAASSLFSMTLIETRGSGSWSLRLFRSRGLVGEGSTIFDCVERRAFLMMFELGMSSPILKELIILFRASRFYSRHESSFSRERGFLLTTVFLRVGE